MLNYVSNLETSFASIVAATGRTANKLELADIPKNQDSCIICSLPKSPGNVKDWLDNITVRYPAPDETCVTGEMMEREGGEEVTGLVCYGCYILFRGLRGYVSWPI